ncbi:Coiled-coil domain-containing protein 113 [Harpegnathos saltator]|uniref:Cilia- and flagella-associated protein 263 n=1 Tax=Harpegnathos saltator TaxID=610380 RepID=E2BY35_HARSA|nr:Coiled-coil domain-containing protein 113 [Harpegnathos saltator]
MSRRQSSIFNLGSLGLTFKLDESYYEDMTDSELRQTLENIAQSNLLLKLENDVFERHLLRQNPESLQTITQILETAKRVQKIVPQHVPLSPVMDGSVMTIQDKDATSLVSIQSGSRYATPSILASRIGKAGAKLVYQIATRFVITHFVFDHQMFPPITSNHRIPYAHRIEMVNTEIQQLLKELTEVERKAVKRKMYLQAQIKENEISIRETSEMRERFEKDVVEKGVDSITGKIPAEKFVRFVEECLKAADTIMERIRMKTMTTKIQKRKAKQQLKHRQELGEALRAVDFEQLNIENQDCIRKIDEKTQHMLEMKKIAGSRSIALTRHKEKLSSLVSTVNAVRAEIALRKKEMAKLQTERADVNVEIEKTQAHVKSLTELMDNFSVPEVLDCIKIHTELQKLQKVHKQLHRQRKLQQTTFKSSR